MLTKNNGVIVTNRSSQQPFCISGICRRHDLDTGNRSEQRVENLRMLRPSARARTDHRSDHHRCPGLPPKHVTKLRNLIQNLIETDTQKIDKHELRYRTQTRQRRATRGTHNS